MSAYRQEQVQCQQQLSKEDQIQLQEIRYQVFQDFKNVMGIATELQALLEFFKDQYLPNHPLIAIHTNRLVVQINISNAIHFDTNYTAQSCKLTNQLQSAKACCKQLLKQLPMESYNQVQEYIDYYINNNLTDNVVLQQIQPKPVTIQANFDEKVVSKVFAGMQQTDNVYYEIKNGRQFNEPNIKELINELKTRFTNAKDKLTKNYVKPTIPIAKRIIKQSKKKHNDRTKQNRRNH